jgi:hypothetical protein
MAPSPVQPFGAKLLETHQLLCERLGAEHGAGRSIAGNIESAVISLVRGLKHVFHGGIFRLIGFTPFERTGVGIR